MRRTEGGHGFAFQVDAVVTEDSINRFKEGIYNVADAASSGNPESAASSGNPESAQEAPRGHAPER